MASDSAESNMDREMILADFQVGLFCTFQILIYKLKYSAYDCSEKRYCCQQRQHVFKAGLAPQASNLTPNTRQLRPKNVDFSNLIIRMICCLFVLVWFPLSCLS